MKQLTPGSLARIYRGGEILEGNVLVPSEGPLTVRSLAPGAYVARDDCGGEIDFEVTAGQEETTVFRPRGSSDIVGVAEPGKSFVLPVETEKDTRPYDPLQTPAFPNVGMAGAAPSPLLESDNPGVGPAPARRKAPSQDVGPGALVPGGPGSGIVIEESGETYEPQRADAVVADDPDAVPISQLSEGEATPEEHPEQPAEEVEVVHGRPVGGEPAQQNPPVSGEDDQA